MSENEVRKKRSVRSSSIVLAIVLAVLVVAFVVLRTDFFARAVGRLVTERLLGGTHFSVGFDKVEGSMLEDVTLKGVKVRYEGPGTPFDLFRAEELSLRYNLVTLIRRESRIADIVMIKPVLRLKADSTGSFMLPVSGGPSKGLPVFDIDRFSIEDGRAIIESAEGSNAVDDVNVIGSIRSSRSSLALTVVRASARDEHRHVGLRNLRGAVVLSREVPPKGAPTKPVTRVTLDSLSVVLNESAITCSGSIVPSTRQFDVLVDAQPLDVGEITGLLGMETSHYGVIEGAFTVKGKPERFRLAGKIDGLLSGYALRQFDVDLLREKDSIKLYSFSGDINGAHVDGHGSYALATPNVLTVDMAIRDLDLSKGFLPKRELPETRFTGKAELTYRVQGEALSFSLRLGEGNFKGLPFAKAVIRGSYAADTLKVEDVFLSDPEYTLEANGTIVGDSTVSLFFNVASTARSSIFRYFGIEQYRADVRLNGRWEGSFGAYDLRLSGTCGDFTYHGVLVPNGEMRLAIEKEASYTVFFDLEGPGCRIGPVDFTAISLSLEYHGGTMSIKKLTLTREDFEADIAADVEEGGKETSVRFKECSLDALGERWVAGGAFTILIADSLLRFDDLQFHSRAGAAYIDGTFGTRSNIVRGRFAFDRFDLGLLNRSGLLRLPVGGKLRGAITCSGPYTDPDAALDVAVTGGLIDTVVVDSLRLKAQYARGLLAVDSLLIASPAGSLDLAGKASGMPVRDLIRRGPVELGGMTLAIKLSCRDLDIVPLVSLAGIRAVTGGRLNGSISVDDSLVHPLVSFTGRIEKLSLSSFTIPAIDCEVKLDRSELVADGTLHMSPTDEGAFHGAVPVSPARFLYSLDRVRPVSLVLNLPRGDLAAMPGVTDVVAEAAGQYSGQLRVTGTVTSPHLNGELRIRGASLRLSGMEEKYRQVNATVRLQDTLVTVAELNGKEGKKGTLDCSGSIILEGWKPGRYHLTANLNDFLLASMPNVLAIVSGTLRIDSRLEEGKVIPAITGSCEVKSSELSYDISSFSSSQQTASAGPPTWFAAVDLKVPGNTWVRTPDARVELQGDITLRHDDKGTYLSGELNLVRGWFNVYNNKFNITSGKLQFILAGSTRPVIDIEAETPDPEGNMIYLTFQWHQDDLQPRLSLRDENPAYSETDIWKMLGGGVVAQEGQGTSWSARNTAQGLAANYIERLLNSQMEGLTIEVESGSAANPTPGMEDFSNTRIGIGKYLSEGLYVKYKQGLSISTAREIDVEYRISNLFLLRSEMIRYSEKTIQGNSPQTSDEISVDLKFRWEF
jgi:hypothetical protein